MTDKVTKFIQSLDEKTKSRLKEKLLFLKKFPFQQTQDVKKLKCKGEFYRLRMGKIRIIYKIIGCEIEIVDIDYRGNVY